jgi:cell division protein FtsN
MRFEIRAGGGFLILLGLVGLSGAVFALGLVAGYEMARQNQPDLSQISSTYPLPNPPEKPAPVAEMPPAAAAAPSIAEAPPPPAASRLPAPAIGEKEAPVPRRSPAAVARVKPPAEESDSDDDDTDEGSETASASAPAAPAYAARPSTKPYNIQIQAVMDKSGADEMVARLKTLGYNAQEERVALDGQTWYRVHVGPYASADEATAAQSRLREQYKQAYTTSH